jgi:hypothetical protein
MPQKGKMSTNNLSNEDKMPTVNLKKKEMWVGKINLGKGAMRGLDYVDMFVKKGSIKTIREVFI